MTEGKKTGWHSLITLGAIISVITLMLSAGSWVGSISKDVYTLSTRCNLADIDRAQTNDKLDNEIADRKDGYTAIQVKLGEIEATMTTSFVYIIRSLDAKEKEASKDEGGTNGI